MLKAETWEYSIKIILTEFRKGIVGGLLSCQGDWLKGCENLKK